MITKKTSFAFLFVSLICSFSFLFSVENKQATTSFIDTKGLVCVDSMKIFAETKEGKKLKDEITSKVDEYQKFAKEAQDKVLALEKDITEKEKVLSQEKLKEKKTELEKEKQKLASEASQRQYVLNAEFQRKQENLRDSHLSLIKELSEQEKWTTVLDKNMLLFSSQDVTDKVLKFIDQKYEEKNKEVKKLKTLAKKADETKAA